MKARFSREYQILSGCFRVPSIPAQSVNLPGFKLTVSTDPVFVIGDRHMMRSAAVKGYGLMSAAEY
jgi:hypothetical protein